MNTRQYCLYIMTNHTNRVLYVGVTSNLKQRVYHHKHKCNDGFTAKYNVNKLVYYEVYYDPINAIAREKQIKAGPRRKKIELITNENPDFKDLYKEV